MTMHQNRAHTLFCVWRAISVWSAIADVTTNTTTTGAGQDELFQCGYVLNGTAIVVGGLSVNAIAATFLWYSGFCVYADVISGILHIYKFLTLSGIIERQEQTER